MTAASPLGGRVVVVTGGNGGIGLGLVQAAASAGAEVMIWGRDEAKTAAAVATLRAEGLAVDAAGCDVSDRSSIAAALDRTVERFGRIDGFVANAAVPGAEHTILTMPPEAWREVIEVNLTSVFTCFQLVARQMVAQGDPAALVAISSIITRYGAARKGHYAAAKVGVESLVRTTAAELARHRIRCNALAPGWTATNLVDEGFRGHDRERFEEAIIGRTPARRWASVDDYAPIAVALLDPDTSFHTGDVVTVDGGYTIS